jgi:hypothetical protein
MSFWPMSWVRVGPDGGGVGVDVGGGALVGLAVGPAVGPEVGPLVAPAAVGNSEKVGPTAISLEDAPGLVNARAVGVGLGSELEQAATSRPAIDRSRSFMGFVTTEPSPAWRSSRSALVPRAPRRENADVSG